MTMVNLPAIRLSLESLPTLIKSGTETTTRITRWTRELHSTSMS
jgi:hypothetical protein